MSSAHRDDPTSITMTPVQTMLLDAQSMPHAAHPDAPCRSVECLRSHCRSVAAALSEGAATSAGAPLPLDAYLASNGETDSDGESPHSTRSGTSPGYANDWALRPEPLAVRSDRPSRTRSDQPVRLLAKVALEQRDARVSSAIFGSAVGSVAMGAAPGGASSTAAARPAACASALDSAPLPDDSCATMSRSGNNEASSHATPSAALPLQPTVGRTSNLLQRRQQRKKEAQQQTAISPTDVR